MSATYDCECDNFEMMEDQDAFSMNEGIPGPGVPAGGSAGQILQKRSQEDYDTEWVTPDGYVPAGGSAGQILKKSSAEDYDTEWDSLDAGDVSFDSSLTYEAGTVGEELSSQRNTLSHKADVIYDTASGDIASFPDGADGLPVKDLTVAIEPVQDTSGGDPSPTHICPISGWTGANVSRAGKNLLHNTGASGTYNNVTYTKNEDGSLSKESGTSNGWTGFPLGTVVLTPGSYILSSGINSANQYNFYISTKVGGVTRDTSSGPTRFTVSEITEIVLSAISRPTVSVPALTMYPMIRLASDTDQTFVPYKGNEIYSVAFPPSAGTVYGGTLELPSCVLTVTDANIASYNGETLPGEWISDRDVYAVGTTPTTGAQVVYKLATSQTYQLTPTEVTTLLGQNNIWTDCGPSTVEYQADTKLYIQKINAPTDDDMIADANIASGKYFIVNNNLYLSTAAILAGDPIKPGTNCTLTNLAAALNALNS